MWAGFYELNTLDQNAIIGKPTHPTTHPPIDPSSRPPTHPFNPGKHPEVENLFLVNGFSGMWVGGWVGGRAT